MDTHSKISIGLAISGFLLTVGVLITAKICWDYLFPAETKQEEIEE